MSHDNWMQNKATGTSASCGIRGFMFDMFSCFMYIWLGLSSFMCEEEEYVFGLCV